MEIFNTKTRIVEKFKPLKSTEVKVYYCGPTVYNYAHLGNLKTSVVEDMVVKTLKFLGYNVKTTMNITDVDDKTIRDSMKAGETLDSFTQKYTQEFLSDIEKLGIEKPDIVQPVTQIIPEMVRMIQTMINRGYAYYAEDGSIYFNISQFKKYGELAHLDMSGMKSSVRINNDEYEKENVADFVLWKSWKEEDGDNYWEEKFIIDSEEKIIKGRPGWHIECSACAMKHFWPQIDIHMGGEDLIFPHHQNEIAQTESCTGKEFSKYWIHSGHLMVDGKKMSKSLGNFYNLRDIEEKYPQQKKSVLYRAIRLSFLNGYYRDTIDFSFEKLEQLLATIKNIDSAIKKIDSYESDISGARKYISEQLQEYIASYIEALENDFSLSEAISVFFEFQRFALQELKTWELSREEKESFLQFYDMFNQVLGIVDFDILSEEQEIIPDEVLEFADKRVQAKKDRDFELADTLRKQIEEKGYIIKDTREWYEILPQE